MKSEHRNTRSALEEFIFTFISAGRIEKGVNPLLKVARREQDRSLGMAAQRTLRERAGGAVLRQDSCCTLPLQKLFCLG